MAPRVSNDRLLWFKFDCDLTKDQVETAVDELIHKIETQYERGAVHYIQSFVGKKDEVHLWFHHKDLWARNILLGLKPDGSENVEFVEDSEWVPASDEELAEIEKKIEITKSWSEKVELSDLHDKMKLKIRPVIKRKLSPLIDIPFDFFKGSVQDSGPKYRRHVLIVKHPVTGLMHQDQETLLLDIANYFSRFASTRTADGRLYPQVTVVNKLIRIAYQEGTDDAVMALNMVNSARYRTTVGTRELELEIWYEALLSEKSSFKHPEFSDRSRGGRNARDNRGAQRKYHR